jgi:hypothetical protein
LVERHDGLANACSDAVTRLLSWLMVLGVMVLGVMATTLVGAGFAPYLLKLTRVGPVPSGGSAEHVWAVLFAYPGAMGHVGRPSQPRSASGKRAFRPVAQDSRGW